MTKSGMLVAVLLTAANSDCLGVGRDNDIVIGADGLPLISYQDGENETVKIAHCEDLACTRATLRVLDADGSGHTSLASAPDGNAFVAYEGRGLRVAHCRDAACGSATLTLVDELPWVAWTSVAFGKDGRALISYRNEVNGDLKLARCRDLSCTRAAITTLVGDACCVGRSSTLAVGSDGLALIAYYDDRRGLSVVHCEDAECRTATFSVISSGPGSFVGRRVGLAIGADGLPLIAYEAYGGMKVAHCQDAACRVVDGLATVSYGGGFQGGDASIAISGDGLPLIAYQGPSLLVAHCGDLRCQSATVSQLSSDATYYASVAIGADGLGVISFWQTNDPRLKVAHCLDTACTQASVSVVDAAS